MASKKKTNANKKEIDEKKELVSEKGVGNSVKEEGKVEEAKAEEAKVEENKAEEAKTEETKAEETKVEEAKAEETKAEETKIEETKAEETKAEETKAEEAKAEETKPEETKTTESMEEPQQEKKNRVVTGSTMPVVREWKEAESESGKAEDAKSEDAPMPIKKFFMGLFGIMGTALAVAVIALAVCLIGLSKELKAVQAVSASLQTDLALAEEEVNRLSLGANVSTVVSDEEPLPTPTPRPTATPRPTQAPEQYTVCIDAGHGAHDAGAVLEQADGTFRMEKDDNLRMAKLVQKELEAYGVKVIMTREEDNFLELYDRTFIANSLDVDALISFHRNAFYEKGEMSNKVSGVEIWVHSTQPSDAVRLANGMLRAIKDVGGMKNRGLKYGSSTSVKEDYAINRRALMTSMIVELGFVSNESDNAALDAYGEEYAKVMAKEIYEWLQTLY